MRGMNQLLRENICMFNGPVKSVGQRMKGFRVRTQDEIRIFCPARKFVRKTIAFSRGPGQSPRPTNFMSLHPSLKGKGAIQAKRSVLKRFERVDLLKKRGQFKDGQRVIGLPKTKPEA
jgi:small basic protein (TIGR04137 family)